MRSEVERVGPMTDEQAIAIGLLVILGFIMGAFLASLVDMLFDTELLGWYMAAGLVAAFICFIL